MKIAFLIVALIYAPLAFAQRPAAGVSEASAHQIGEAGKQLLEKARKEFSAAKTEEAVIQVYSDRALEMFEASREAIPIDERKSINNTLKAMEEEAYKKLNVPAGVEVVSAELYDWTTSRGITAQGVKCRFKNTGKLEVATIWGTVSAFDAEGKLTKTPRPVILFAGSEKKALQPGQSIEDKYSSVSIVARPKDRVSRIKIDITRVVHKQ